jgi:uncharacterized protein YuzE
VGGRSTQAKGEAGTIGEDGAIEHSWDRTVDAAYISLIPCGERMHGVVDESVTLEDVAENAGIDALHSLVLDFDRDGKLIGIEVLGARAASRESTLRAAQ